MSSGRALAIMAKAPRAGHVKTRLRAALPSDAIVDLYRSLIEDTVDLARSLADVDVALVCPAGDRDEILGWLGESTYVLEQEGEGLAGGLISAFRLLLSAGSERVIAFNGDSPHLPREILETAFALLESSDVVVGPTADGGYYLVGSKEAYPELFDRERLGTETALQALLERARRLGLAVELTAEWYDVDEPPDLLRLAADLNASPLDARRTAALLARWQLA